MLPVVLRVSVSDFSDHMKIPPLTASQLLFYCSVALNARIFIDGRGYYVIDPSSHSDINHKCAI
jgi:hypothetical protein